MHLLQYFERDGLPEDLRWIGEPFRDLATELADRLPDSPELEAALRKLLEARDCAARAANQRAAEPDPDAFSEPDGPVGEGVKDVRALLARRRHAPVVYFLRNGNRVKIGTTQGLRNRISSLSLRVEDLLRVEHGGPEHERSLHERFAAHQVGNTEWFSLRGEIADHVAKRETIQDRVRNALTYYGEMRRRDLEVLIGISERQALDALRALRPATERTNRDTWRLSS